MHACICMYGCTNKCITDPTNTVVKKPNEMPMDSLGRSIPTTPPTNDPVSIKIFIMIPNSC